MNKRWIVACLILVHFGITLYMGSVILGGVPHTADSAMYYREAIILGGGKLYLSNFTMQPREAFLLMGQYEKNDRIFIMYPHFWPFLMAIFIKLHIPTLLNPLLSALNLLLIFLIGRKLFDEKTGIIAAVLYCVSPLVIILAGEYMMHMATLFFLLASFYLLLVYVEKAKMWMCLFAGLSLGYAFALRPLTAIGVFIPIGIYLAIVYRGRIFMWRILWFILGFSVLFGLFLADNYLMTGEYTKPAHPTALFRDERPIISSSNFHNGMNNADSMLALLSSTIFYGFIPHIILALAAIPVMVLRKKEHLLCLAIFLSLVLAYALTYTQAFSYGPRYYFEGLFAIFILAAQGMRWVVNRFSGKRKKLAVAVFVLLLIYNVFGLVIILPKYENYNSIPTAAVEILKNIDLENSILIIGRTWNWFEDGITAVFYDPEYKKSFIIKELKNGEHLKVLDEHPEKAVYIIKNTKEIVPFNVTDMVNGANMSDKGEFKISYVKMALNSSS